MTNNPRVGIVDGSVNIDDVLNNEIGAIVRMRQPGVTPWTYCGHLQQGKH